MKKLVLLVVVGLILLAGCIDEEVVETETADIDYTIFYVDSMPCVWAQGYKSGGLSCDWSKYHPGE